VLFPDSIATLEALRRRGYRLGCVTNRPHGGARFIEELRESGLLNLFEALAVSCDDGWLKPNAALFRLALDDLDVAAGEAMMVGDDLRADVMGRRRSAWWRCGGAARRRAAPGSAAGRHAGRAGLCDRQAGELLALPALAGAVGTE
jgi:FMN phosphatase YigB (HAD superfamily)